MSDHRPDDAPFRYAEHAPSASLAPWVLSLWSFRVVAQPASVDPYTVFPDGCTSIAILRVGPAGPMLVCLGPRLTAARPPVSAQTHFVGFRLWPDCSAVATGLPARVLRDFVGPVPPALAERFDGLQHAVSDWHDEQRAFADLDRALVARFATLGAPEPRIRAAVSAIVAGRGAVRMDAVARAAGLGLRQLQRHFPETTGLTLREFARVRRLREALSQRHASSQPGWSRIAAGTGFVDQAHLTREFRALTGIQPTIAARQLGLTDHGDVTP